MTIEDSDQHNQINNNSQAPFTNISGEKHNNTNNDYYYYYDNIRRGAGVVSGKSGRPLELDLFLPSLSLAFEFQVPFILSLLFTLLLLLL